MTFREKYAELEHEFQQQVECDNKELGIESSYAHNFIPQGPVDYILIAMEPSTGVPGKDHKDSTQIARNFTWSVEDFMFHYCIRKYLLQYAEAYHLTDLAKGGMNTGEAQRTATVRYKRWYPLLKKELHLLTKPEGIRIIAIGNYVAGFLNRKKRSLHERVSREPVKKVLHYTRRVREVHVDKNIERWSEQFSDFSKSLDGDAFNRDFEESIKAVLHDACMDSYIGHRPQGGKLLNDSRKKKLMFYYKNRFSEIRDGTRA